MKSCTRENRDYADPTACEQQQKQLGIERANKLQRQVCDIMENESMIRLNVNEEQKYTHTLNDTEERVEW